jgi:hypothetical protein
MCYEFGMSALAMEAFKKWMEGMTSHHERSIEGFESRIGNVERLHNDQGKKIKDMETQRKRLEVDLQNKALKVTQLGMCTQLCMCTCVYICIYIYAYMCMYIWIFNERD